MLGGGQDLHEHHMSRLGLVAGFLIPPLTLVGCAARPNSSVPTPTRPATGTLSPTPTRVPIVVTTPVPTPGSPRTVSGSALQLHLIVAPVPQDLPPYDRSGWSHWVDAESDCQDARQEALISESMVPVTFKSLDKCSVASGRWIGP